MSSATTNAAMQHVLVVRATRRVDGPKEPSLSVCRSPKTRSAGPSGPKIYLQMVDRSSLGIPMSLFAGCSVIAEDFANGEFDLANDAIAHLLQENFKFAFPIDMFQAFLLDTSTDVPILDPAKPESLVYCAEALRLAHDVGCADYARYLGIVLALCLDKIHASRVRTTDVNVDNFFLCVDIIYKCGHSCGHDDCTILVPARMLLMNWWWSMGNYVQSSGSLFRVTSSRTRENAMFAADVVEAALTKRLSWDRPGLRMLQKMCNDLGVELNLDG